MMPITIYVITRTWNLMITINGNSKRMTIGNLVKLRIKRITTTSIKIYTTILNVIMADMVFATLVNDLKMIYLNIIKWNYVRKTHD